MSDLLGHDDFRLADLRLAEPQLRACAAAGIDSIAALAAAGTTAVDPQLGAAAERARAFLDRALPRLGRVDLDRPLAELLGLLRERRRVGRALEQLGLRSVGQLLACPEEELLAARGVGPRTLAALRDAIGKQAGREPGAAPVLDWLPDSWLELRLEDLGFDADDGSRLTADGARTLRDLLLGRGPADPRLRGLVRRSLERHAAGAAAPRAADHGDGSVAAILDRCRAGLEPPEQQLLDHLLGLGRRPTALPRAALFLRLPVQEAEQLAGGLRQRLRASFADRLAQLAAEARAALAVHEGVVGVDDLALGTALHGAARSGTDPGVPLRLLAFTHPERWCFEAERLCATTADQLRLVIRALRRAMRSDQPPVAVATLTAAVAEALPSCPPGVIVHALRRILGYSLSLHPDRGEVVTVRRTSLAARLEALLDEAGAPVALDDLLFAYRDRHGRASRRRIADALRSHGVFLEIAPSRWSLHARHVDELELLRPEAERLAAAAVQRDERLSLGEHVGRGAISERSAFLLADLLRRAPELRALGRGDFVPRARGLSDTVQRLVAELQRAMGEVPFSRFLQNQPPRRHRLVARLLRCNRRFVSPAPDRIDLAENYPLAGDRLRMILHEVRICLEEGAGYATVARARRALDSAGLGGVFLSEHLLLDIVRRHGEFELLPGGWIAAPGTGLARWIQRTAREILRSHLGGLTHQQIVAERPELAEFRECLAELLEQDPLVQTADGLHYQLA
jgi:hypothetical protein